MLTAASPVGANRFNSGNFRPDSLETLKMPQISEIHNSMVMERNEKLETPLDELYGLVL